MRDSKKLEARLTREQITAAQLMAVNQFLPKNPQEGEQGRYTYDEIAEKSGITVRQLYNWRHYDENFVKYVGHLASNAFLSHLPDIMEKHLDMTLKGQGSMKGIELFYKFGGLLVDKTEVKTEDVNAGQSIDERLALLQKRANATEETEGDE
ncbi:phBC6A51 family helix-turn-helix protein [Paenibacillus planticolens]|nr:phBC6A51 family helix-turn-helix protein [Paenibacillus planticolens]